MSDLLDRIRKELTTRVNELRPLHEEHARLEMASRALNEAGTSRSDGFGWPRRDGLKWPHLALVDVGVGECA